MKHSMRESYKQSTGFSVSLYLGGELEVFSKDLVLIGFKGKAQNPTFNYRFKDLNQRDTWLSNYVEMLEKRTKERAEFKAQQKEQRSKDREAFKAALKPGVILYDSWGYEQTNVEFYVVVSVKGSTVEIQELGHKQDGEATSWASCYVIPDLDNRMGEVITKRVGNGGIKVNSCVYLRLWDGKRAYKSWYA